jgi:pimeloyl-ACP methyl ester carboxylesterase
MARRIRHPGLHDARGNEVAHRLVEIAGVETYVADAGEGPAIVLLHGYGDTADAWRRVVPGLLKEHRVVALDMPPFGRSAEAAEGKLLDFYGEFFPSFLDEVRLDRATVIGHSLGGGVALRLAIENPERVERLGLVAPAGLGNTPPWWWHALTARAVWQGALAIPTPLTTPIVRQGLKSFLALRLFADPNRLGREIKHLVDMHGTRRDLTKLLAAGHACIDSYTGQLLERSVALEIPLWMVWGRQDGLVPSMHARAFASAHPNAKVHVLDDCGHYPHIELPQRFNQLLRSWLDETAPAPRARRRTTVVA